MLKIFKRLLFILILIIPLSSVLATKPRTVTIRNRTGENLKISKLGKYNTPTTFRASLSTGQTLQSGKDMTIYMSNSQGKGLGFRITLDGTVTKDKVCAITYDDPWVGYTGSHTETWNNSCILRMTGKNKEFITFS